MRVKFNNIIYQKDNRSGRGLNSLCFNIFKHFIDENPNMNYKELKELFNKQHCSNNFTVLSQEEWSEKSGGMQERYFKPIEYRNMKLYFTTQWGNNGLRNGNDCDNINRMIEFAKEKGYDIEIIENDIQIVRKDNNEQQTHNKSINTKNIILYGPPGVGKTYNHKKLISLIESGKNQKDIFDEIKNNNLQSDEALFDKVTAENRFKFVTFHQSYSYEDFIEGFRPNEDGSIKLEDGIFKQISEEAYGNPQKNYYLLIDEINRGNISKIFGELITLIEDDKRDEIEVSLPYSKELFKVPSNLYIIATMNSTDKSIALIDVALRRRFTFLKMEPDDRLISHDRAREIFNKLNIFIEEKIGKDYLLGHSYFMGEDLDLDFVLEYKIRPLLEEYFYGDEKGLEEVEALLS